MKAIREVRAAWLRVVSTGRAVSGCTPPCYAVGAWGAHEHRVTNSPDGGRPARAVESGDTIIAFTLLRKATRDASRSCVARYPGRPARAISAHRALPSIRPRTRGPPLAHPPGIAIETLREARLAVLICWTWNRVDMPRARALVPGRTHGAVRGSRSGAVEAGAALLRAHRRNRTFVALRANSAVHLLENAVKPGDARRRCGACRAHAAVPGRARGTCLSGTPAESPDRAHYVIGRIDILVRAFVARRAGITVHLIRPAHVAEGTGLDRARACGDRALRSGRASRASSRVVACVGIASRSAPGHAGSVHVRTHVPGRAQRA